MDGRWEEYFSARHWRVAAEYTGTSPGGVEFRKGKFELPLGQVYDSPLSANRGRRGVLLQEVNADGNDIPGLGHLEVFGDGAYKRARSEFKAIL
jgi:hypothetical protein